MCQPNQTAFFINVLVMPYMSRILYHMSTKQTAFYQCFGSAIKEQNIVLCANQTKPLFYQCLDNTIKKENLYHVSTKPKSSSFSLSDAIYTVSTIFNYVTKPNHIFFLFGNAIYKQNFVTWYYFLIPTTHKLPDLFMVFPAIFSCCRTKEAVVPNIKKYVH